MEISVQAHKLSNDIFHLEMNLQKNSLYHFNPSPAELRYILPFANSVDPDQLASEEAS